VLDGDAGAADHAWHKYRQRIRDVLAEVKRMRPKVEERENFRVGETVDELDTGIYAHIFLTFVHGDDKPFVAFTRSGSKVKFSARGSPSLYNAGVDLSIGMKEAGEALGGNGGGHPAASGAAVPKQDLDRFLDLLDASLGRLRKKGAT
jgi:RecJ-like exonuclease